MNSICIIRYAKREGITFRAPHLISSVTAAIKKNSPIWFSVHRKKLGHTILNLSEKMMGGTVVCQLSWNWVVQLFLHILQ